MFNAAEKTKKIKEVESEIIKVKSFILKNREMQQFLENPTVGRDAKKDIVVSMLTKQKYSDLVVNFFKAMADNGRLNDSLKVMNSFEQLMRDYNSEVYVQIVSNQVIFLMKNSIILIPLGSFKRSSTETGKFSSDQICFKREKIKCCMESKI